MSTMIASGKEKKIIDTAVVLTTRSMWLLWLLAVSSAQPQPQPQAKPPPPLLALSFKNAAAPTLPPVKNSTYDSTVCMNPFLTLSDDGKEWRLYYAGADNERTHRIALATAPVVQGTRTPRGATWTRQGVVLNNGTVGSFNSIWSVLPLVHKFGNVWHMYFTGRSTSCPYTNATGVLQTFWGIGLATSHDGIHFTQRADPVMLGNETKEYPHNYGVAGGGTIIEDAQGDGSVIYRQYYTLAVGGSPGVTEGQRKLCAVAHSKDGVVWSNHSIVLGVMPTATQPREDTACAAPVVWIDAKTGVYRMVYSAIGTKWGFYSLAQASSYDGYTWYRGRPGTDDDLVLAPDKSTAPPAWDSQMVEYASIWPRPHAVAMLGREAGKAHSKQPKTKTRAAAAAAAEVEVEGGAQGSHREEGGGGSTDGRASRHEAADGATTGKGSTIGLFYAGNGYGDTGIGYIESSAE